MLWLIWDMTTSQVITWPSIKFALSRRCSHWWVERTKHDAPGRKRHWQWEAPSTVWCGGLEGFLKRRTPQVKNVVRLGWWGGIPVFRKSPVFKPTRHEQKYRVSFVTPSEQPVCASFIANMDKQMKKNNLEHIATKPSSHHPHPSFIQKSNQLSISQHFPPPNTWH